MKIQEWMIAPDIVGKTIASIQPCVNNCYPSEPEQAHVLIDGDSGADGDIEADAWLVTFTDGSAVTLTASYSDSSVHIRPHALAPAVTGSANGEFKHYTENSSR